MKTITKTHHLIKVRLAGFIGRVIAGDLLLALIRDVQSALPKNTGKTAVAESLFDLAGKTLTEAKADLTAWRMAANTYKLSRGTLGEPVPIWTHQAVNEWVPAQIESCRRMKMGPRSVGYNFSFVIMGGQAAGMKAQRYWSDAACSALAGSFGFSFRRASRNSDSPMPFSYSDPRELVRLRLSLLLEPCHSSQDGPGFFHIREDSSAVKCNRQIMALRDRLDEETACPNKQPDTLPCHRCPWGYESCPAGTHPRDYVPGICTGCAGERVAFDPSSNSKVCVDCTVKAALKGDN